MIIKFGLEYKKNGLGRAGVAIATLNLKEIRPCTYLD